MKMDCQKKTLIGPTITVKGDLILHLGNATIAETPFVLEAKPDPPLPKKGASLKGAAILIPDVLMTTPEGSKMACKHND